LFTDDTVISFRNHSQFRKATCPSAMQQLMPSALSLHYGMPAVIVQGKVNEPIPSRLLSRSNKYGGRTVPGSVSPVVATSMSLFVARINPCEKQVTSRLNFLLK
jgi:hypothetical protein